MTEVKKTRAELEALHNAPKRLMPESVLRRLTEWIAGAYTENRRKWWSATRAAQPNWTPSAKDYGYFRELAGLLREEGIEDYSSFVRLQFESKASRGDPPSSRYLCGSRAFYNWRMHHGGAGSRYLEHEIRISLSFCTHELQVQVAKYEDMQQHGEFSGDPLLFVLIGRSSALSAMFRYCVAAQQGLSAVMQEFLDEAAIDYLLCRRAYDLVWGDFVPQELKDVVDAAVERWRKYGKSRKS